MFTFDSLTAVTLFKYENRNQEGSRYLLLTNMGILKAIWANHPYFFSNEHVCMIFPSESFKKWESSLMAFLQGEGGVGHFGPKIKYIKSFGVKNYLSEEFFVLKFFLFFINLVVTVVVLLFPANNTVIYRCNIIQKDIVSGHQRCHMAHRACGLNLTFHSYLHHLPCDCCFEAYGDTIFVQAAT